MKKILCILLLFFIHHAVVAQIAPVFTAPSPNAQSLGVFGEFSPSGSTGVPNIVVSVHEMKYRDISVPITLNYNPNLVKPDIHSGWVGLGWNLSVGGAITRIVNDKPDDMKYYDE